jgi:hypothetical protein
MNMEGPGLTALIVCSDERSGLLAGVLQARFLVFRRSSVNVVWRFSQWRDGGWVGLSPTATTLPRFDVLFFHTGQGDPSGIPAEKTFGREFAFSEPGLRQGLSLTIRPAAIPIPRRFDAKHCPVRPRDIPDLVNFVAGNSTTVPPFCQTEQEVPLVDTLGVMCQSYLSTLAAAGKATPEIRLALEEMGWTRLPDEVQPTLVRRLKDRLDQVESSYWWAGDVLGLLESAGERINPAKWATFEKRLLGELGLESLDAAPDAVKDLLKPLRELKTLNDPSTIAHAYLVLKEMRSLR